ncbi:MAG: Enoyl-CoA hydratase [Hydrogenibacillus schlegelii]|uniref:Enoyl-CoA hydratase n=1 Tax=Hydrogenibacillus schlegelii TaxID=1484 RepID=A0A2T5GDL2_HYDSH|nr:MAG: Enoyl-CoA hydratase [Hydrogenibacillus schlegelii]
MNEHSFKSGAARDVNRRNVDAVIPGQRGGIRLRRITRAAVLGAGVMGAGIAAHLANVGLRVLLMDMVPKALTDEEQAQGLTFEDRAVRNRLAEAGKARLLQESPSPLYTPQALDLIETGNFEDDLHRLSEVDWIIEAIVEDLGAKRALLERVEPYWREGTVVSTNTSGISIARMVEGRSPAFRRHFLGTHFFNPPRYLPLLELIPHPETDPKIVEDMRRFAEVKLGKGVVVAKDTPNFIANRIGTYGLLVTYRTMEAMGLSVEAVDAITGEAMGRPKSATFRTLDVVGLDTFLHVANNVVANVSDPDEKAAFRAPDVFRTMVERGLVGQKRGAGFYKQVRENGEKKILALDLKTLEYRPRQAFSAPSLVAGQGKDLKTRLERLLFADDVAGRFAWEVTKKTLLYAAAKVGEIADSPADIDRAMKLGFGWSLGPFELWDLLGVRRVAERMKKEGETLPDWVEALLREPEPAFYRQEGTEVVVFGRGGYAPIVLPPEALSLKRLKAAGRTIGGNRSASLVDLGDGVLALEFHSKGNALGTDIVAVANEAFRLLDDHFDGLVVGNEGKNFSAGANLMLMLMEAEDENWDEIDRLVREFQAFTLRIKYARRPVVAAPFGMTLGGGYEVAAAADRIVAAAETYMGLVETAVGLIPAGGGTKEFLLRMVERVPEGVKLDLQPLVNHAFETIAMAKVSTSGEDARRLGYLRPTDAVVPNREHLLAEAKRAVLELVRTGYTPPAPRKIPVVGEPGYATMRLGIYQLQNRRAITDHDAVIADKLAFVLAGGRVPKGTLVDEQYFLYLEREAFLSLIGMPKTQARMAHMLKTGKPLRN